MGINDILLRCTLIEGLVAVRSIVEADHFNIHCICNLDLVVQDSLEWGCGWLWTVMAVAVVIRVKVGDGGQNVVG